MPELEPHQSLGALGSPVLPPELAVADRGAPVIRDATEGESRRRSVRRRVLRRALIVHRGGYCTLGCNILNVSETGALLMPADMALCPSTFVLKPPDGLPRHCEVMWRKGGMIGVRFL